ncbi:MAG: response regulator transcription factor [Ruminococcaceae bacterium]|nr:response regulator transcription factor [Oscillospiraceae bacterium]
MKILLADDETNLRNALAAIIKHDGYEVTAVCDGQEAVEAASEKEFDVMIFDVMMPRKSGIDALKEIRSKGILTPVILLTAMSEIDDKINGLDSGADDYLTKPISMGELLARIRAAARRGAQTNDVQAPAIITFSNVSLNTSSAELSAVNSISLAAREMKLLEILAGSKGKAFTGDELFGKLWRDEPQTSPKVVDVYISYLRNKLRAVGALCTITGDSVSGYVLG